MASLGFTSLDDYVDHLRSHPEELFPLYSRILSQEYSITEHSESFRKLYKVTPAMMHSIDREGRLIGVTDMWLKRLGYRREEVIGRKSTEFLTEADRKRATEEVLPAFFETGYIENVPYDFVCKDGSIRNVLLSATSDRDESGAILVSYAFLYDITDLKHTELELTEAIHFIEKVADTMPSTLFVYDLRKEKSIYINNRLTELLGYPLVQASEFDAFLDSILHPEDRLIRQESLEQLRQTRDESFVVSEYRLRTASNEWRWFRSREKVLTHDEEGVPIQTVAVVLDVTEEKNAEEQLLESEASVRTILDSTRHAFYLIQPDFTVISFNKKAKTEAKLMLGLDLQKGVDFRQLVRTEFHDLFEHHFSEALKGQQVERTLLIDLMRGYTRWFNIQYNPARDRNGEIIGVAFSSVDITEQVEAQRALEQSEARWKFALEGSNEAVWDWNIETGRLFHSERLNEMFGFPAGKKFQQEDWLEFIHPEDKDKAIETFKNYLYHGKEGTSYEQEYRLRGNDDVYRWVLDRGKIVQRKSDGSAMRFIGTYSDISARKQQEARLAESEHRYAMVLDTINAGIWEWNVGTQENYASPHFFELLGYEREEIPKKFGFFKKNVIHPEDLPIVEEALQAHFEHRAPYYLDYRLRTKSGGYKWFNVTGKAEFDAEGKPITMLGSIIDIDQRKQVEETVRQRDHLLHSINENISEGLYRFDRAGSLVYVNKAFLEIFGYSEEEVLTGTFYIERLFVQPAEEARLNQLIEERGRYQNEEVHFRRKDGSSFWALSSSYPTYDEHGSWHCDGALRDITEQKMIREELARTKLLAAETKRLKANFLANMSHEVRTPINGILGLAQIIRNENQAGSSLEGYLSMIEESGERLLRTINSILNLARVEAEKGDLQLAPVSLTTVLEKCERLFTPIARQKELQFECALPEENWTVLAESSMLEQVFDNLLSNAFKFTEQGSVRMQAALGTESEKPTVKVQITDTGIGIHEEFLTKVFQAFEQESSGMGRSYGGTGLGLAISKKYIELLGGSIQVESTPGTGSTFHVILPLHAD
ncbi:MAG: PAS domain S-box protein [Leptolyngbya sp. SIO3F4]|nr:PAS domain S-box protein [Leptolyngbya sp. SIO3F4]